MFTLLRICSVSAGLILVYAAAFLYEGERQQVQDRLEDLWIRIHEARRSGVNFSVAFVNGAAFGAERGVAFLFGPTVWSRRAIWGSVTLTSTSIIPYALWVVVPPSPKLAGLLALPLVVFFLLPSGRHLSDVLFLAMLLSLVWWGWNVQDAQRDTYWFWNGLGMSQMEVLAVWLAALVGSVASDFLLVAALRAWTRKARAAATLSAALTPVALSATLGLLLVVGPYALMGLGGSSLYTPLTLPLGLLMMGNSLAAALSLCVAFVAVLLTGHLVIAPLVERLVYLPVVERLMMRKKTLAAGGAVLLSLGIPNWGGLLKALLAAL